MIIYRELRWGHAFSYGPENKLRLDSSPLIQLVGKNGNGKSSIGLILEEVQFKQCNLVISFGRMNKGWKLSLYSNMKLKLHLILKAFLIAYSAHFSISLNYHLSYM